MKRALLSLLIFIALATVPRAQLRVVPVDAMGGHVALGLALRHLANTGILMQTTAHPDDENNGLLVMLNRGTLGDVRLLSPATVRAMTSNQLAVMPQVPEEDRRCRPCATK